MTGSDWEKFCCFNVIILKIWKILVVIRVHRFGKWWWIFCHQTQKLCWDYFAIRTVSHFYLHITMSSSSNKKRGHSWVVSVYTRCVVVCWFCSHHFLWFIACSRGGRSHFFRLRSCSQIFKSGSDLCPEIFSCSDSAYNHWSKHNFPMFIFKKSPHSLLLLPKLKSDFGSGSEQKAQNLAGVDSGSGPTSGL